MKLFVAILLHCAVTVVTYSLPADTSVALLVIDMQNTFAKAGILVVLIHLVL